MHVHLPKPLHGWREFAGEVGIIVLGVLIALGAEQFIQMLNWRSDVAAERRALRGEVRYNLTAALFRRSEQPCIDRRLREIALVFQRKAAGQPLGLRATVRRPAVWGGTTGTWDIALSGQALAHMPLEEKLDLSNAFSTYRHFRDLREQEDQTWRTLGLLDQANVLNDADWSRLHEAYADANAISQRMRLVIDYQLQQASLGERAEMPTDTADFGATERAFCSPMLS